MIVCSLRAAPATGPIPDVVEDCGKLWRTSLGSVPGAGVTPEVEGVSLRSLFHELFHELFHKLLQLLQLLHLARGRR